MKSKKARSAKRSATRKPHAEQLKESVFFVDRSSGKHGLVNGLRQLGLNVERHDDHFDETTPDPTWISFCGKKNWIIVSSDKAIKKNTLERLAIMSCGVATFFFGEMKNATPLFHRFRRLEIHDPIANRG